MANPANEALPAEQDMFSWSTQREREPPVADVPAPVVPEPEPFVVDPDDLEPDPVLEAQHGQFVASHPCLR